MSRQPDKSSEIRKVGIKHSGKGSESYFITIPKELVEEMGWRKGQKVVVKKIKDEKKLTIQDWQK